MKCFSETEIDNPKFPKLSKRARFLKESEGGIMIMCDVMEEYMEEVRQEERAKALKEKQEGESILSYVNFQKVKDKRA